jgi:hypothetical protein
MKATWFLIVFMGMIPVEAAGLQASTPQAALEELATADKPEIIARHLPEPVRKSIEDLPRPVKQQVMSKLMELKSAEFNGWTVRRAEASDGWEIVDSDGESKGKVTLQDAFISGLNAILPLQFNSPGGPQMFIVTMHLDGDEWRIDSFGPWEKTDPGLQKLLRQPSEMEKNDAAAKEMLNLIRNTLQSYAALFPGYGYPHSLRALTERPSHASPVAGRLFRPLLPEPFAEDPAVVKGYEFRYVLTMPGDGDRSWGTFQLTASPVEFGKTGSRHYLMDQNGAIECTQENRPATEDDDDCPAED